MTDFPIDPWIEANLLLPPANAHAIGVITIRWNWCEVGLFLLLTDIAGMPHHEVWAMTYDLGDLAMCDRVKTFAQFRNYHTDSARLINNALAIYDICRRNRNSIVHAWVGADASLSRSSRKSSDAGAIPFPSSLADLRRVADDIKGLDTRLWLLNCLVEDRLMGGPLTSPGILPLPELLLTHPAPTPKAPLPQPRSSPR